MPLKGSPTPGTHEVEGVEEGICREDQEKNPVMEGQREGGSLELVEEASNFNQMLIPNLEWDELHNFSTFPNLRKSKC